MPVIFSIMTGQNQLNFLFRRKRGCFKVVFYYFFNRQSQCEAERLYNEKLMKEDACDGAVMTDFNRAENNCLPKNGCL